MSTMTGIEGLKAFRAGLEALPKRRTLLPRELRRSHLRDGSSVSLSLSRWRRHSMRLLICIARWRGTKPRSPPLSRPSSPMRWRVSTHPRGAGAGPPGRRRVPLLPPPIGNGSHRFTVGREPRGPACAASTTSGASMAGSPHARARPRWLSCGGWENGSWESGTETTSGWRAQGDTFSGGNR